MSPALRPLRKREEMPDFVREALERSGLVSSEKSGRVRTCSLTPGTLRSTDDWLRAHIAAWEGRLDRLEAHLSQTKEDTRDD